VTFRRTVPCPACSKALEVSRLVFLPSFACRHCGVALKVSLPYLRSLVALSCLLGYALAWEASRIFPPSYLFGIPTLFLVLWAPIGFLSLSVLVRVVPFLIKPKLVLGWPSEFTTLGLTSRPKDDPAAG
jgi:hypothetical protein